MTKRSDEIMVQVDLSREGGAVLTTWVDKRPDLKEGAKISLKDMDPEMLWNVDKIYDTELPKSQIESNRNFDNNNYDKHEGLKLDGR